MDDNDDYGLSAYQAIASHLDQWGESSSSPAPPSSARKSSRFSHDSHSSTPFQDAHDTLDDMRSPINMTMATPDKLDLDYDDDNDADDDDVMEESVMPSKGGVETPMPARGRDVQQETATHIDDFNDADDNEVLFDGVDSYQPYRDAVFTYLQNRKRIANLNSSQEEINEGENALMQIDDNDNDATSSKEDSAALQEADVKFLDSLASICFSRSNSDELSSPHCLEGNLWDLMSCLRSRGLHSLFYRVNTNDSQTMSEQLEWGASPESMLDDSPASVVNACLGSTEENPASLPLERLNASLEWIQGCHNRKWQTMRSKLEGGDGNDDDPLLPPPRRRTMWPATLESMKNNSNAPPNFHPDAPLLHSQRSSSPTTSAVLTLNTTDEQDDARLLRACFVLFQSGRQDQAIELTKTCGQPWRSIGWLGGEAFDDCGNTGNPTRRLWKRTCRRVLQDMMTRVNSNGDGASSTLYSSLAYEAAILAILSDNVEYASKNPVFDTWEDSVHAILSSERGWVQENVLVAHDEARVEAVGRRGDVSTTFPYAGMEGGDDDAMSHHGGYDGDMGAALQMLEEWGVENVREGSRDPYRNGMLSFLIGNDALKEFIQESSNLVLEAEESEVFAELLRFVVHLVLYVDTVLPEFAFELDESVSLREELLLKYTNHLTMNSQLWGYVPLYTSLLSNENILGTFSEFLIHVHNDQQRQMLLGEARDLFPTGLDRYVLRNVVRDTIQCDKESWQRELGEGAPPSGITPADARMMRSVLWLCYYPEHYPDALVCANMLLRRFMLESSCDDHCNKKFLLPSKYFISQILPHDINDTAASQAQRSDDSIGGCISMQMVFNLQAEFLSIKTLLDAHTNYVRFMDVIMKTSPCHQPENKSVKGSSAYETEIAQKMEKNAFRQKKIGLCKIVIDYATNASKSLTEVLTFGGGWLVDQILDGEKEDDLSDEAKFRLEEMKQIRSIFVSMTVFMLHEILSKTAMWMEQIVYDTIDQFGGSSRDMLLTLFGKFDDYEETTNDTLVTSPAAPAYWHRKAVSLASIVANDDYEVYTAMGETDMKKFLNLMADSKIRFDECANLETLFDV